MPTNSTTLGRVAFFVTAVSVTVASGAGNRAVAQPKTNVTTEDLRDALAERDAIIIDLMHRVEALEHERASRPGDAEIASAGETLRTDATHSDAESEVSIDELRAERALERSLVEEGARLLPPGRLEIVPGFTVRHYETDFPSVLSMGSENIIGEEYNKLDLYEREIDLRFGLPWASQLEIGIPYRKIERQMKTAGMIGSVQSVVDQSGSGAGDITLGFAKILASESNVRPNLIGRLVWLTGSGDERDGAVQLGGGTSGVGAQLSASWRRDPVVFTVSGDYTHYDEHDGLRPGESVGVSLGLGLAINPDTALMFSLDQAESREFERNGVKLAGTDGTFTTLGLSAATILGRRLLLRVNTGIGLTEDAPDYRFGVSLSTSLSRN